MVYEKIVKNVEMKKTVSFCLPFSDISEIFGHMLDFCLEEVFSNYETDSLKESRDVVFLHFYPPSERMLQRCLHVG